MCTNCYRQFDHAVKLHVGPSWIDFGSDFPSILNQTGYAGDSYKEA